MMTLAQVLKATATVAGTLNPTLGAAIALVNPFLPKEHQLPSEATGAEVEQVVRRMPPEQQRALMEKEIELKVAQEEGWTERYKAQCAADGQTTRPKIALMMAKLLAAETLGFVVLLFWQPQMVSEPAVWAAFLSLTAVPGFVLRAYFGDLRREHQQRQAVYGAPPVIGVMDKLLRR